MSIKAGTTDLGQADDMPTEPETTSTHQEEIPVPVLGGTRCITLRWLTLPMKVFAVQAPDARPGKK